MTDLDPSLPLPDVSWLTVGASIYAGPTEVSKYRAALEAAGLEFVEAAAEPSWGADVLSLTRTR